MTSVLKRLALTGLLVLPLLPRTASAYYDPGVQRWLNRDPAADLGFISLSRRIVPTAAIAANIYRFVGNRPVLLVDPLGLTIYYCTVPTSGFPTFGLGRHAYLWDDRPGLSDSDRECGQESSCSTESSGHSSGNTGPGGLKPMPFDTICVAVPGSEDKEQAIMDDCIANANAGWVPWLPLVNDCHNKVKRCLKRNGLTPPSNPRFNNNIPSPPIDVGTYDPGTGVFW
jgi:RHS repeat-associated protein